MGVVSKGKIASDLRDLTQALDESGSSAQHGILGGEWGYGAEFENDVFEMHPYWWDDCTCGHEEREIEWAKTHDHGENCCQMALRREGAATEPFSWETPKYDWNSREYREIVNRLCAEYGLDPVRGSAVHCTCGRDKAQAKWAEENPHPEHCPLVRPNFRHKRSGLSVSWYKYIGRGMEVTELPERKVWADIINNCLESIDV